MSCFCLKELFATIWLNPRKPQKRFVITFTKKIYFFIPPIRPLLKKSSDNRYLELHNFTLHLVYLKNSFLPPPRALFGNPVHDWPGVFFTCNQKNLHTYSSRKRYWSRLIFSSNFWDPLIPYQGIYLFFFIHGMA